ncbi:MAG: HupE/UreJ family protein, partial [Jannaschia sp.]
VTVSAHEVQPAVADVRLGADEATMTLRLSLEPIIAGIDLTAVSDTNESPLAGTYDRLRALPPDALEQAFREVWPTVAEQFRLSAGDMPLSPDIASIDIPEVGNTALRRDSTLTLTVPLPDDDSPVVVGWDQQLGGLILRQVGAEGDSYEAYLTNGTLSDPMPRTGVAEQGLGGTILRYVVSGFDHIIPKGLDHILFVLGLFFYALAWRPLLWQVTAFTAAHTVTLALATTGVVSIPESGLWIVETIIAASIVYVAVENIFGPERKTIGWGRIGVVFGFGLLHGLGFASVLSDFGLDNYFVASLISFNVGVELGQLAVIAIAFLLLGLPFGRKPWYRRAIAIPCSAVIAAIGTYWVLNRIGFVGDLPLLT